MQKPSLTTILLGLILAALVIIIVGGISLVASIRGFARPLEQTGRAIEERLEAIANPTPTIVPHPVTIIREVRSLSRLETASYSIEKIITAESGQSVFAFLFGDRLLLVAHGQVVAGIDLSKLEQEDVIVGEDGDVIITLPPAEVFVSTLDNHRSYVYDREVGVIGFNPDLETAAREAAEDEILKAALEDGVLELAQRNGEIVVRHLITALGFHRVTFRPASPAEIVTPSS